MAYIINGFNGEVVAIIPDGTVDTTSTTLQLVGRSVTEYGVAENENYVWLMQHFAGSEAPPNPLTGQLWYNSNEDQMYQRTSLDNWVGLASTEYVQAQKVSPIFSGVPQAPTATTATTTNQIATTAFVQNNKVSPAFTGIPTAPTAGPGSNTTQIATTAFVTNSVQLQGVPTAPTATPETTNTTQIATTEFVQNNKLSPVFTGVPTAPTAPRGTSNTQIATTAFVSQSPIFYGTPEAPTAAAGTGTTQLATTAFVTNSVQLQGVPIAPTAAPGTNTTQIATTAFITNSVQLAGTPTAPTVSAGDNTTSIATTAFVQQQKIAPIFTNGDTLSDPNKVPRAPTPTYPGIVLNQIATVGYIGQAIAAIDLTPYAPKASPVFTGVPQAPTAATGTNNQQLATTAFVRNLVGSQYGLWQGSAKYVSTGDPSPGDGNDGDFWFKYQP
jgi:hypothetical protein